MLNQEDFRTEEQYYEALATYAAKQHWETFDWINYIKLLLKTKSNDNGEEQT